jgi:hypothetical protein
MDQERIRAWWSHRQGLDGSLQGATPSQALAQSGWARSVGGVGPYLTMFARAGSSRQQTDDAVVGLEIHELPSARGCTYVVPAADFALALKVGQGFGEAQMKVAARLGVTDNEIDKLCTAVVDALSAGPLDPDGIRAAVGGAARSLGDEGKKKGITTTLPVALGRLQALGEIRRVPANGRLDQQRYRYVLWRPNPLAEDTRSTGEAFTELARRFFTWVGPATLGELQWFTGLGVAASRAAIAPLGLVPLEPESDRLLLADHLKELIDFEPPTEPGYVLVSSLDAISATRRDVAGLLDDEDAGHPFFGEDKSGTAGSSLSDLPHHAILDRGRLVGFWEYDVDTSSIVWFSFRHESEALDAAVAETERFIREELGDARSFSLDSPRSRAPKIEKLRRAAATSR